MLCKPNKSKYVYLKRDVKKPSWIIMVVGLVPSRVYQFVIYLLLYVHGFCSLLKATHIVVNIYTSLCLWLRFFLLAIIPHLIWLLLVFFYLHVIEQRCSKNDTCISHVQCDNHSMVHILILSQVKHRHNPYSNNIRLLFSYQ